MVGRARLADMLGQLEDLLNELPYDRYMEAVVRMCEELAVLCADDLPAEARRLIVNTAAAARDPLTTRIDSSLSGDWKRIVSRISPAKERSYRTCIAFEVLAGELTGKARKYAVAEIIPTVLDRQLWVNIPGTRMRKYDPAAEVSEEDLDVRTTLMFLDIVRSKSTAS
jgi:hypothetical protein